jgi:hypothetical protein
MAGVAPLDVLFVADGRWWSFLCDRASCCPPEGAPVDAGASAIAALSAYSGLAVLPNRAALAAGLEPYGADMPDRMRTACDAALNRIAVDHFGSDADPIASEAIAAPAPATTIATDSVAAPESAPVPDAASFPQPDFPSDPAAKNPVPEPVYFGDSAENSTPGTSACCAIPTNSAQPSSTRILDFDWSDVARAWQLADSLCDGQVPPDRALTDEAAGELLVAIADVRVRDYLATWCGDDRAGQAVALSVELARRSVTAEQAAATYAIAAWAAWALGWGAWSRLCLERAARAVPGYALASLIKQGLERGVGPELVREAARGTARRLDEMRTEHQQAAARARQAVRVPHAATSAHSHQTSTTEARTTLDAGAISTFADEGPSAPGAEARPTPDATGAPQPAKPISTSQPELPQASDAESAVIRGA